jgi:hypothetical protein
MSLVLRAIGILAPQEHLTFYYYSNGFSFDAKKEDLFFLTHGIISLLPIGPNSFVSRLVQRVILLTYEHVSFN